MKRYSRPSIHIGAITPSLPSRIDASASTICAVVENVELQATLNKLKKNIMYSGQFYSHFQFKEINDSEVFRTLNPLFIPV